jgi:sugar phosphate isomerase/epimerase
LITVTARVSDPYGVAHVAVSAWWCSSSGTRVPSTVPAVLSSSPGNTPADGNWSANLPTNGYIGEFFYGITTTSVAGTTTGPLYGNVTVTGVGANCGTSVPVPAPVINVSSIAPFGGGYAFSWTENLSAGVIAYTALATPTLGGTTVTLPLGNVTSVRFGGLTGNASYQLRVAAYNPAGGSAVSAIVGSIKLLDTDPQVRAQGVELDRRRLEMAKALGAKAITTSTTVSMTKRIAPVADKHKMLIGYHGHDQTSDANQFATLESYATAFGYSRYNGVNLDIGHFTASNYDAIAFIKEHHARITNLHVKDRKKDHGPNTPWGQGDTPIKEVLQLLRKNKYPFPANIELEYTIPQGSDVMTEMAKCLKFCKDALA